MQVYSRRLFHACAIVFVFFSAQRTFAESEVDSRISGYEMALQKLRSAAIEYTDTITIEHKGRPTVEIHSKGRLLRDSNRIRDELEKTKPEKYRQLTIVSPDISVALSESEDKADPRGKRHGVVFYSKVPNRSEAEMLRHCQIRRFLGYFLLNVGSKGSSVDDAFLPEVLKRASLRVCSETKNGKEISVLSGSDENWNYRLVFDAGHNYPQAIELSRSIAIAEVPIGELAQYSLSVLEFDEGGIPKRIKIRQACVDTEGCATYDLETKTVVRDSNVRTLRRTTREITFNKVESAPSFSEADFALSGTKAFIKIPNGTRVSIHDAPRLHFIWHDGKIIQMPDER